MNGIIELMTKDLNPNEDRPEILWAEIHRLREELKGPEGYNTWKEAAVAERVRRVKAETALKTQNILPTQSVQKTEHISITCAEGASNERY